MSTWRFSQINFFYLENVESFVPEARYAHSVTLVDNKLYFFGGQVSEINQGQELFHLYDELFYLDVSKTFNIEFPSWKGLTASKRVPVRSSWTTSSVGVGIMSDRSTIYLIGGLMYITDQNAIVTDIVYAFDTKSQQWKLPVTNGTRPNRRREVQAVSDNTGKIHYFGGRSDYTTTGSPTENVIRYNILNILDTSQLSWSIGSMVNAPSPREGYSATLFINLIIFIGGKENSYEGQPFRLVNISQIPMYDTQSSTWYLMIAGGANVGNRYFHSAILAQNDFIIVYGGTSESDLPASQQLIALNTTSSPYQWIAPKTSCISLYAIPPPLSLHSATFIEKYMIIAFGNITNARNNTNPNIYLLDTTNWTWVTTFNPSNPFSPALKIGIISAVIGVTVFILIIVALIIILHIRARKKNNGRDLPSTKNPPPSSFRNSTSNPFSNIQEVIPTSYDDPRFSYIRHKPNSNPLLRSYSILKKRDDE
ncbi:3098_t:CDS:2 [Scutellospora calospora]|uniref:3098_t:CDS:1 n=1 Tax=Scutellospora calospora TaxID=85575 RepID=A0ACA9LMP3_9GLOM|nr:3098_t:CDS:2 [Scutellospora calospora]